MSGGSDLIEGEAVTETGPADLAGQAVSFFSLPDVREVAAPGRLSAVLAQISATGSYAHSYGELLAGATLAWRNHARCIGRYNWKSLKVLDARSCATPAEVAQACWEHLLVSTNGGRLRPVVTVFKPYRGPGDHVRVLSPQLIRYAGYRRGDGSVVGDPLHVRLTERVTELGWRGAGTAFDVLPLLLRVDGRRPALFDVPAECVMEVPISHPRLAWFAELGLRWHANPAISDMCLEVGGLRYTAAPFSGWYVSSEIGARNLSDENRYNMLPEIARRMGLDTRRNASLWQDRAMLELNEAILFSYAAAGVYIVDHHTASTQFVAHVDREATAGRRVPVDWAWINPPMSASTTPTFHRAFDPPEYHARPNFVRQADE